MDLKGVESRAIRPDMVIMAASAQMDLKGVESRAIRPDMVIMAAAQMDRCQCR